tara:strand:- start:1714 stop:2640 length:927 start_codon:yes stop_codon:yes gene_type:complete
MRIVSLIASATEIVHFLGLTDYLVGVSHECDFPNDIKKLPICSKPAFDINGCSLDTDKTIKSLFQQALSIYSIDEKLLYKLNPDIIITQSQCNVCAVSIKDVEIALQKDIGINPKIISLNPMNLEDVWKDIYTIATNLDAEERGKDLMNLIRSDINNLKSIGEKKVGAVTVACIEWIEPLMYASNWVPDLVELAGGIDLFGTKGGHSSWSSNETLFDKNPDKIILMPCGYDIKKTINELEPLRSISNWSKLRAVRTNNVFITDGNQFFNRPGPRLVDSLKILIEILQDNDSIFGYKGKAWVKLNDLDL